MANSHNLFRISRILLSILIASSCSSVFSQNLDNVSVHLKMQALQKGEKLTIDADYYYNPDKGILVTHHLFPTEFVKITNRKGEMKLYFPQKNELSISQDSHFSSTNELLYYFVNNLIDDLGLQKEGFTLSDSRYEDDYLISTWSAPETLPLISKVEIVFENMMPIYSAYYTDDESIIKKIYYSDYYIGTEFMLPQKITEINFNSQNDSTIRRMIYSDIKINNEDDDYFLNYKIPEDAKVVN